MKELQREIIKTISLIEEKIKTEGKELIMTKNQAKKLHDKLFNLKTLSAYIAYHDISSEEKEYFESKIVYSMVDLNEYFIKIFKVHESLGIKYESN